MQGKNKRDGSRRSRNEKKKRLVDRGTGKQNRGEVGPDAQMQVFSVPQRDSTPQSRDLLTHLRFAGWNVQLNCGSLVLESFAYDITNWSLSPFDCCVNFESIAGHMVPFEKLQSNKLFLNSIMATGYALHDFKVLGKSASPTPKTTQHVQNTLSLLQASFQDPIAYREEWIIHAVLNLAMLAAGYNQWAATVVHLRGLQKIIHLNGGLQLLARWPKLQFKLDR